MSDEFDLEEELKQAGLTIEKLGELTGKNRTSVWRWRKRCPAYVKTIITQQRTIHELRAEA